MNNNKVTIKHTNIHYGIEFVMKNSVNSINRHRVNNPCLKIYFYGKNPSYFIMLFCYSLKYFNIAYVHSKCSVTACLE